MNLLNAIFLFTSLGLFVTVFYWPWQRLCVDWTRQLLFEERDKLFEMGVSGKLPFDSPIYRETREQIEGTIRLCHQLTWPRMLLFFIVRPTDERRKQRIKNYISMIENVSPPSLKSDLRMILTRVAFASIVCFMGRSIFLGPVFLFLYFCHSLRDHHDNKHTQRVFSFVQEESEIYSVPIMRMARASK
jgi:hypothetical protein